MVREADDTTVLLNLLAELGFAIATRDVLLTSELRLMLALREFQTYAQLENVAHSKNVAGQYWSDQFETIAMPPEARFGGTVDGSPGDAGSPTRNALQAWQTRKLRCPVIVECWPATKGISTIPPKPRWWMQKKGSTSPPVGADNLWWWAESKDRGIDAALTRPVRRLYVRDYLGRLDTSPCAPLLEKTNPNDTGRLLLGRHYLNKSGTLDGPCSSSTIDCSAAFEIQPQNLSGNEFKDLTPANQHVYRIIRAAAECECGGFYDSINAYDGALLSFGPFQWTLGHFVQQKGKWVYQRGELEGFLAYLRATKPAAYQSIIGTTGIEPSDDWANLPLHASKTLRKYESSLSWHVPGQQGPVNIHDYLTPDPDDAPVMLDFLRSWHWFYRWQLSARTNPDLRLAMWDMTRMRMRDILSAPAPLQIKRRDGDKLVPATLGDVFRSERTIGYLLQWHIQLPGHLFGSHQRLTQALKKSGIDLTRPTDDWTSEDEQNLESGLVKSSPNQSATRFYLMNACRQLRQYCAPTGEASLSGKRLAVALDFSDLGPSPF